MQGVGGGVMHAINAEVARQAAMIAYIDNFYVMFWLLLIMAPMPFLLGKSPNLGRA
jgi:DHA2 family multidrug resistance protein